MTVFDLRWKRLSKTELEIDVHCSSGFYVRSLAHDLGVALECGAHLSYLRRTQIKSIGLDQAMSLEILLNSKLEKVLKPIDSLLQHLPSMTVSEHDAQRLLQGQTVHLQNADDEQLHRLYVQNKVDLLAPDTAQLFAVGRVLANRQLKTEKIFMLD